MCMYIDMYTYHASSSKKCTLRPQPKGRLIHATLSLCDWWPWTKCACIVHNMLEAKTWRRNKDPRVFAAWFYLVYFFFSYLELFYWCTSWEPMLSWWAVWGATLVQTTFYQQPAVEHWVYQAAFRRIHIRLEPTVMKRGECHQSRVNVYVILFRWC